MQKTVFAWNTRVNTSFVFRIILFDAQVIEKSLSYYSSDHQCNGGNSSKKTVALLLRNVSFLLPAHIENFCYLKKK